MRTWDVPLFDLSYDHRETEAVQDVLRDKWLSSGPRVEQFETQFAEYLGGDVQCCAVANCTAALHMALLATRVGPGDEVIVSGLTFVAAINVVVMTGATPVVADSKSFEDWNVSPADIASKITARTRAIIVVHFAGYPCDVDEIVELARTKGIVLIEDVAHAIGAEFKGRKCGTFGDIACFSFFSNKNLSTGEGGMFVSRDDGFAKMARLLRSHGMSSMTIERQAGKTISYDVTQPGLNYRMDEIRAALGLVQLSKLDIHNAKREERVRQYVRELVHTDSLTIPWPHVPQHIKSSYHIFPVLLAPHLDRNRIIHNLQDDGIQTSVHYPAFNQFAFYRSLVGHATPTADDISARALTLPLYPLMGDGAVTKVCTALLKSM